MTNAYLFILAIIFTMGSSCGDEEIIIEPSPSCDLVVEVNEQLYNKSTKGEFQIISTHINGDCLFIAFSAGGCDGTTWEIDLFDQGVVAESLPEQRYIRLSLDNKEECDAVITIEKSFDLTDIRIQNGGVLLLNLDGSEEQIRYEY